MHRNTVVIAGGGPLGLSTVQVAHLKTPKRLDFPLGEWERAFTLANSTDSIKVLLKPGRT
jgi:hypothetical protein